MKERRKAVIRRNRLFLALTVFLFVFGGILLWLASLRIPALDDLSERKVVQSTKIYDRTGEILLYDMSRDVKRTIIPFDQISPAIKNATLAIEDKGFYDHGGVKISSFIRALLVNIADMSFTQGGSTITQQVVKNSILTGDKTPTRKIKEWILAIKLENNLSKDEIFSLYLNEIPYGGSIYGIEEASQNFFGKSAKDLTVAEASYLAALAKAPTYYSPYGSHREELEARRNLVLREMRSNGFISDEEYEEARTTAVTFRSRTNSSGIIAPHFVFYVIDELAKRYGEEALERGGLKVITTLDVGIQEKAEAAAEKYGDINEKQFNANNNAIVVIDPKTGGILSMVGSRDYFNEAIQGNFNVATGKRQPGSTFKPIVYSLLFNKGYTPETVLFDVPTQFSARCAANNFTSENGCYSPQNYDDAFRGPITIRNALAQSINIPAVKALYLAGVENTLEHARNLGIENLGNKERFGLTLVLGGGEVSPLDITSAYSVFANDGVRNQHNAILRVEDVNKKVLSEYTPKPTRALPEETARKISSILTDNEARTPAYGANSVLYVPDRDVAVKTGTTNDYRDAWIIGYTPTIAVGAWVGNTNNTPMEKRVAGYIVAPMWRELMNNILPELPAESFIPPAPEDDNLKPVLRGIWQPGRTSWGYTDERGNFIEERGGDIHSILYWVDKDNPRGPIPQNPQNDSQFNNWESSVQNWVYSQGYGRYSEPATDSYNSFYDPLYPPFFRNEDLFW